MPLITIHALPLADPSAIPAMLAAVRDAGAAALGSSPNNIWVMFHVAPPGCYLQGPAIALTPQSDSHPPAVIIRAQTGRTRAEREALTIATAEAVARAYAIPATNVWIHYQEMRPDDVWFGGRWAG